MQTPVLVISGPVGVGKTTVGEEVSEVLDEQSVPHTFTDFDQLRYTYPRIPEDPWSNGLGLQNLESIWKNCWARGARNLVISTVVEEQEFLDKLALVIPNAKVTIFQLFASPENLIQRVSKREIGSGLEWHTNRAIELLAILENAPCDARIETDDRTIQDLAQTIADMVQWER